MKKKVWLIGLISLLMIGLLTSVIPKPIADTQSGFILASAGKDGQFGTNDDITATDVQSAVANKPASISTTNAVPSAKERSTDPQPLRQPNSDEIAIRSSEELAKIGIDPKYPLNGKYILMANLDLSSYSNWTPIGNNSKPFTGNFDGNGLVIKNLTINRPTSDYQGLFGYTGSGAKLLNIRLENVNVIGRNFVGGLVSGNNGTIINSYSTGSIIGAGSDTGGLAGYNNGGGYITNSYFAGNVTGNSYTGGLVGSNNGTITNSYSMRKVKGSNYIGGLVGWSDISTITNSYSMCSVTGDTDTGGLVGRNSYASIRNSYSIGNVTGNRDTGGLAGYNNGTITNSYSTGSVTGNSRTGGLVGINYDTITNSYWNVQTSGITTSDGGTGKTTAQMKQQATFTGWDFTNVWAIDEGKSYPYLRANEQKPHPGTN